MKLKPPFPLSPALGEQAGGLAKPHQQQASGDRNEKTDCAPVPGYGQCAEHDHYDQACYGRAHWNNDVSSTLTGEVKRLPSTEKAIKRSGDEEIQHANRVGIEVGSKEIEPQRRRYRYGCAQSTGYS